LIPQQFKHAIRNKLYARTATDTDFVDLIKNRHVDDYITDFVDNFANILNDLKMPLNRMSMDKSKIKLTLSLKSESIDIQSFMSEVLFILPLSPKGMSGLSLTLSSKFTI
jgi:hypothetical protein